MAHPVYDVTPEHRVRYGVRPLYALETSENATADRGLAQARTRRGGSLDLGAGRSRLYKRRLVNQFGIGE